jgi:hypothetical protein
MCYKSKSLWANEVEVLIVSQKRGFSSSIWKLFYIIWNEITYRKEEKYYQLTELCYHAVLIGVVLQDFFEIPG